jgi:hypothetical protein
MPPLSILDLAFVPEGGTPAETFSDVERKKTALCAGETTGPRITEQRADFG